MTTNDRRPTTREALAAVQDALRSHGVSTPLEIFATYKGHRIRGLVHPDGTVETGGSQFTSLSSAGAAARVAISGPIGTRKVPQTNGWLFWHFDDRGKLRPLADLRR